MALIKPAPRIHQHGHATATRAVPRAVTRSNSSSGEVGGRSRDRALTTTGRSRSVLTGAFASMLMSLVAILASGCDIARPWRAARHRKLGG